MGGQLSQGTEKTPLQCVLDHLSTLTDPGCKTKRTKLIKLSQKIWPLCHVGPVPWPKDGSISAPLQELERYLWLNSREKELPYLHLFFNLASDSATCATGGLVPTFVPRVGKLAALRPEAAKEPTSKVLYGGRPPFLDAPEEDYFPPPYLPAPLLPHPAPPVVPQAAAPLLPDIPPPPVPLSPNVPQPATPPPTASAVDPPPVQIHPPRQEEVRVTPRPGGDAPLRSRSPSTGGSAQSRSPSPPPASPLRRSERARKEPTRFTSEEPGLFAQAASQFPLREVPGPNGLVYIHTPFSSADLFSWKQELPPYRESPQQYVDLVSRIMCTHLPNIPDLFALLSALLNEEEKRLVLRQAILAFDTWRAEYIQNQPRQDGNDVPVPPLGTEILCLNPPPAANDPNTQFGREMIEGARRAVKEGLKKGVPRVVNYQKVLNVVQNVDESPAEFLIRLKNAFRRYTDLDPEELGNIAAIRTSFITQCAPDIRRKIQKMAHPATQPLDTLVQMAFQVYYQRPEAEEAKSDSKMKKKATLLAAALQPLMGGPSARDYERGPPPREPTWNCFNCGSPSHLVRDCPEHRGSRFSPHWDSGPRGPPPPRNPGPRGQRGGGGGWGGERVAPQNQGNRYPGGGRFAPHPAPRHLMAVSEEEQN